MEILNSPYCIHQKEDQKIKKIFKQEMKWLKISPPPKKKNRHFLFSFCENSKKAVTGEKWKILRGKCFKLDEISHCFNIEFLRRWV